MEYIILLSIGICIMMLGVFTVQGNISFIHWYNRMKVTSESEKSYGKLVGVGTIIIGSGISITAILQMIFDIDALWSIIIIGTIVGLILILYAQFKYNRGIF